MAIDINKAKTEETLEGKMGGLIRLGSPVIYASRKGRHLRQGYVIKITEKTLFISDYKDHIEDPPGWGNSRVYKSDASWELISLEDNPNYKNPLDNETP